MQKRLVIQKFYGGTDKPTPQRVESRVRNNKLKIYTDRFSVETASWYPFDTGMCLSSGGDQLLKIWDTNSMTPVDDFQFNAGVNDHSMSLCPSSSSARCLVAVATQV